jgi:hypothetical protein
LVKANYDPTHILVTITGDVSDSLMVMNDIKIPGGIVDTLIDTVFYNQTYLFKYNSCKSKKGKLFISIEVPYCLSLLNNRTDFNFSLASCI